MKPTVKRRCLDFILNFSCETSSFVSVQILFTRISICWNGHFYIHWNSSKQTIRLFTLDKSEFFRSWLQIHLWSQIFSLISSGHLVRFDWMYPSFIATSQLMILFIKILNFSQSMNQSIKKLTNNDIFS